MGSYPDDWRKTAGAIVSRPGTVFVLGGPDTGKTTFCTFLANLGVKHGLRVGIVDADIGQSHIGPPTTIGLGLVDRKIRGLPEAELLSLYFVGSVSPALAVESMISGTHRMVAEARRRRLPLVLVDSTGLIRGAAAGRLKSATIDLVWPEYIVALQKADELEYVLSLPVVRERFVHTLAAPKSVEAKSKSRRRLFRRSAWERYLKDAVLVSLDMDRLDVQFRGPQKSLFELTNVVVGLQDRSGRVRVGALRKVDETDRTLAVLAPPCEVKEITSLIVGSAKVDI